MTAVRTITTAVTEGALITVARAILGVAVTEMAVAITEMAVARVRTQGGMIGIAEVPRAITDHTVLAQATAEKRVE